MRQIVRKGFTLVEILIVVVILGILAAIVVPQFTNATQDAQTGNMRAQKKSLQNQLELFKARTGAYPTLAQMQTAPTGGAGHWGILVNNQYIKQAPKNPFNNLTSIVAGTVAANQIDIPGTAANGWVYDAATGTISPCYYDESAETVTPLVP